MKFKIIGTFAGVATALGCSGAEPAPVRSPAGPVAPSARARVATDPWVAWNDHDAGAVAEAFARDARLRWPRVGGSREVVGRDAIRDWANGLLAALPDLVVRTERRLSNGAMTADQWVMTGTHKGRFVGVEPTQRRVVIAGMTVSAVDAAGRIAIQRAYWDVGSVLAQIGGDEPADHVESGMSTEPEVVGSTGDARERARAKVVESYWARVANRDVEGLLEHVAVDAVRVDHSNPGEQRGHAPLRRQFEVFARAFPDFTVAEVDSWTAGEYVVTELRFTGTHRGPLGPVRPTGRAIDTSIAEVARVGSSRIEATWAYSNNTAFQAQLGLLDAGQ